MKKLLTLSLAFFTFNANALDILNLGDVDRANTRVIVGVRSRHFDSVAQEMLNESNPSLGLEVWDIQAVYVSKNSWDKKSLYLTYSPDYKINDYLSVSAQAGIATGYYCSNSMTKGNKSVKPSYCNDNGVVFMPALTLDVHPLGNGLAFSVSVNPAVAMFSISYTFN
jgi:hypothetical protein